MSRRLRFLFGLIGVLVVILGFAVIWQHQRYLTIRRQIVHDQQAPLYSDSTFHAVSYFRTKNETDLVSALRPFVDYLRTLPDVQLIYAGQAVSTATSSQLNETEWDAVILVQYPSRNAFDTVRATDTYAVLLEPFDRTYTHGMTRSVALNLLLPQLLLLRVLTDTLTLQGQPEPFVPVDISNLPYRERIETLLSQLELAKTLNDEALVMVNLSQTGSAEQQASDAQYNQAMFGRMAHLGYGPLHIGTAVMLDDSHFDEVMLVYYPGASYFSGLISSEFFTSIFGDKQLADYQSVVTVPLLPLLGD